MNRTELYLEYRQKTIEKGINPIGKKRFNGIIDTLQEIEQLQLGVVVGRSEQLLVFAKWLDEETVDGLLAEPEYYVRRYLNQ